MDVDVVNMNRFVNKAIWKYFSTISNIGRIDSKEKNNLFVIASAYDIYRMFYHRASPSDVEQFNRYIACHAKDSCLFDRSVPTLGHNDDGDSLITIIDSDIMETTGGATMVSTQRATQKFTDFEVRTEIQPDNFVVGYDASDNREVQINVNDLGLFWEY